MSASAPRVSVVIPAYNYAHFLPHAVNSALAQTFSDLEILVIDDGSTDRTAALVTEYFGQNPRVRYIHQPNAGLSAARNTGIKNARANFIAFLDADDQWLPKFLQQAVDAYARLPETFGLVACRSSFVDADGTPLKLKNLFSNDGIEITCDDILLKTQFSPSTAVVRREVFASCGDFDTTLRSSEDRDMWLRIAARHKVFLCGEPLVLVRRHATSMSTHADRMKTNTRRTLAKARQNPDVGERSFLFWSRVNSFFLFQTAWMYFQEGRRAAAIGDLLASLLRWPWFSNPARVNEPFLFRLRALKHFLLAPDPRKKIPEE